MSRTETAGNRGDGVRSDCYVSLTLKESGGISLQLNSKVKALYGDSIRRLCDDILAFYGISDAELIVEDSGALPFVIAARLEAAGVNATLRRERGGDINAACGQLRARQIAGPESA